MSQQQQKAPEGLPTHTSSVNLPEGPPVTITSDEINFLVYRYLQGE